MKSKIFFSFVVVIFTAMISNFIFKWFIVKDFDEYNLAAEELTIHWILTSLEESYGNDGWDDKMLFESIHWGLMSGFDVELLDKEGLKVMDSKAILQSLKPIMKKRMKAILNFDNPTGDYKEYVIKEKNSEDSKIGTLRIRALAKYGLPAVKEEILKKRAKYFMLISFFIAGGGSILLAFLFAAYLTNPLKRFKEASIKIAKGDFNVTVPIKSSDEIGSLAKSFNYMAEALRREDRLRKHLMTNITHELRTPLTVMKANLEAVMDGVISDPREGQKNLEEEVNKLIGLVKSIEDVTKAEEGFFRRSEYEKVNLREFLEGLLSQFDQMAINKGIDLSMSRKVNLSLLIDREKLTTVFNNLITNAIKYTEKGNISVEYGVIDHSMFYITVNDTGIGLSEEDQDLIFGRFYKGRTSKGMGVGLSIVKELVDIMKGEIAVKSEQGKCSQFQIKLPLKKHNG